jgi:hypothetical protein
MGIFKIAKIPFLKFSNGEMISIQNINRIQFKPSYVNGKTMKSVYVSMNDGPNITYTDVQAWYIEIIDIFGDSKK